MLTVCCYTGQGETWKFKTKIGFGTAAGLAAEERKCHSNLVTQMSQ